MDIQTKDPKKKTPNFISIEQVHALAKLANLKLTEEEALKLDTQLDQTVAYIENLNELNTKDVSPTAQTTDLKNIYFEDGTKNERQFSEKQALQNGKEIKEPYFVVKRIM